jgi:hypothetical protein
MTEKATPNAVEGVTTDVNLEKGDIAPTSIHSNRHGDATKLNLDAYKSDDSDGKINWTITHRLAAFSLCLLYVGEICLLPASLPYLLLTKKSRIPNPTLFQWRLSQLRNSRYRRNRQSSLATSCEYSRSWGYCTIRRIHARFNREEIYCFVRMSSSHCWSRDLWYRP